MMYYKFMLVKISKNVFAADYYFRFFVTANSADTVEMLQDVASLFDNAPFMV